MNYKIKGAYYQWFIFCIVIVALVLVNIIGHFTSFRIQTSTDFDLTGQLFPATGKSFPATSKLFLATENLLLATAKLFRAIGKFHGATDGLVDFDDFEVSFWNKSLQVATG